MKNIKDKLNGYIFHSGLLYSVLKFKIKNSKFTRKLKTASIVGVYTLAFTIHEIKVKFKPKD